MSQFKSFANVPIEELATNPKFQVYSKIMLKYNFIDPSLFLIQAHALNIMYTITLLVDSLDDASCLVEQLKKLGENHESRRVRRIQLDVSRCCCCCCGAL